MKKIITQILVALLLFVAAVLFWIYVYPELVENNEATQTRYGISTKTDGGVLAMFTFILFGCVSMICAVVNITRMKK